VTAQQEHQQMERREQIKAALERAGQRAEAAYAARGAALAEVGELLRVDAAQPADVRIGITGAQAVTGLSRPTLTQARDDTRPWAGLAYLAGRVLAGDEDARADLDARLPELAGWRAAAEYVLDRHTDVWWEERGGYDPFADLGPGGEGPDEPAAYTALMERYLTTVRRLAAGETTVDPHREDTMTTYTADDVIREMHRLHFGRPAEQSFDLWRAVWEAAGELMMDERVGSYEDRRRREEELAKGAFVKMYVAAGLDFDGETTDTPPAMATLGQARQIMARAADLPELTAARPVDDERQLRHLVETVPDVD
jgi:hypothetical protein